MLRGRLEGDSNFRPDAFKRQMQEKGTSMAKAIAVDTQMFLVQSVMAGSFTMAPLSEPYAGRKIRVFGQQPILVATTEYMKAIKVVANGDGSYSVAVDPQARTEKGQRYEDVAKALEFGTSRMAGRPHWRPAIERAKAVMNGGGLGQLQRDPPAIRVRSPK